MRAVALLTVLLLGATSALAAEEPSGCDKFKWPIERERAALTAPDRTKLTSGSEQTAWPSSGVTLALGYNRRFHPEMIRLRERIRAGELGVIEHIECNMAHPNALYFKPEAWRAMKNEAPVGGLASLGVHAVDAFIDLCGEYDSVYCQSFARAVAGEIDDTSSMLFRMKAGMSAYLSTITTTGPAFSIHVFGSKGWVRLEGVTHVAGASSEERRTRLFGACKYQPLKGPMETWDAEKLDVTRACFEAFVAAPEREGGQVG